MTDNQDTPSRPLAPPTSATGLALDDIVDIEESMRHRGRRFWRRLLLACLVLLLLALVLAPRLASLPAARRAILAAANSQLQPKQVDAEAWQLRWLGPQKIDGLAYSDPAAATTLDIRQIKVESSLWRLIPAGRVNLGKVTITQPRLQGGVPPQPKATEGTATAKTSDAPPATPPAADQTSPPARLMLPFYDLAADLRIVDGSADYRLADGGLLGLEAFQTAIALASLREPCPLEASWRWRDDGGTVAVQGTLQEPLAALENPAETRGDLQFTLDANRLAPLAVLFADRFAELPIPAEGLAGATIAIDASGGLENFKVETIATVNGLRMRMPGETVPAMPPAQLRLALQGALRQGRLTLTEAALASPWASASATADLLLQSDWGGDAADQGRLTLRVELAPLVRDWGTLLKLDPGLAAEGVLLADFSAGHDIGGLWTQGSVATTNLTLRAGGKTLAFSPPPALELLARRSMANEWRVDNLSVQAPFATLAGSGDLTQAYLKGNIDLTRMANTLRPIIPELPGMVGRIDIECAGRADGDLTRASAALIFTDVAVESGTAARPWVIEAGRLTAAADLPRHSGGGRPLELLRASLGFAGTPGTLTGSCARVVMPSTGRADVQIEQGRLQASFDLERMLRFTRPLVSLPSSADVAGQAVFGLACEAGGGLYRLSCNGVLSQLALSSTSWDIREPDARFEGLAAWDAGERLLSLSNFTGRASFGKLSIPSARAGQTGGIGGELRAELELAPLWRWRKPSEAQKQWQGEGRLDLQARAVSAVDGSDFEIGIDGKNIVLTPPEEGASPWREPAPAVRLAAHLTPARDRLDLQRLTLTNSLGFLTGAGVVTNGESVTLAGDLAADFDAINRLLRGRGIEKPVLGGCQPRPFAFHMPLGGGLGGILSYGDARMALHLASLQGFGLKAQPADLQVALSQGHATLRYTPALEKGTLSCNLGLAATASPPALVLPEGALVIRDAPLDNDMLAVLGFFNPLLANCTALAGRVSIGLDRGGLPLGPAYTRETAFEAVIEINDAVLAPAGVLEQILAQTGNGGESVEIEHAVLRATCRDGRIVIAPHAATIDGHPVTFQGSVGLDRTIQFQTVVPLTAKLVGDKAARYIAGKTLTIPATGTIRRPRIDSDALAQQVRQFATEALQQAVAEQAGDLLEKLRKKIK